MEEREITNVDKPENRLEAIRRVAGPWGVYTLPQAVAWAKISGNKFIVRTVMATVDVKVMSPKSWGGNEYLQTRADYTTEDNLLSLPPLTSAQALYG